MNVKNRFVQWWNKSTNKEKLITDKDVIFGPGDKTNNRELLSACIMVAKWYIHKSRQEGTAVFLQTLIQPKV